jgi:hypothetical protein
MHQMQGALFKRGDHRTSAWRPRHFELGNDGVLRYKLSLGDAAWRGELCLEGCRVDAESGPVTTAEGTVGFPLTITHPARRVSYHLAAGEDVSRTVWCVRSGRPHPPVLEQLGRVWSSRRDRPRTDRPKPPY